MDVPASQDSGCLTGSFGRSSELSSAVKASAVAVKKKNVKGREDRWGGREGEERQAGEDGSQF